MFFFCLCEVVAEVPEKTEHEMEQKEQKISAGNPRICHLQGFAMKNLVPHNLFLTQTNSLH